MPPSYRTEQMARGELPLPSCTECVVTNSPVCRTSHKILAKSCEACELKGLQCSLLIGVRVGWRRTIEKYIIRTNVNDESNNTSSSISEQTEQSESEEERLSKQTEQSECGEETINQPRKVLKRKRSLSVVSTGSDDGTITEQLESSPPAKRQRSMSVISISSDDDTDNKESTHQVSARKTIINRQRSVSIITISSDEDGGNKKIPQAPATRPNLRRKCEKIVESIEEGEEICKDADAPPRCTKCVETGSLCRTSHKLLAKSCYGCDVNGLDCSLRADFENNARSKKRKWYHGINGNGGQGKSSAAGKTVAPAGTSAASPDYESDGSEIEHSWEDLPSSNWDEEGYEADLEDCGGRIL